MYARRKARAIARTRNGADRLRALNLALGLLLLGSLLALLGRGAGAG